MKDERATSMFLHSLWDGKPDEAYLLVWTLQNKASAWFRSIDEAAAYISRGTWDIYTGAGCAGKPYGPDHRCVSEEITGIGGIWADIDMISEAHAGKPLPATREEALSLLPSLFVPTYTISTGNGLQVWLMFREPWIFYDDADRNEAAALEMRFQTVIARRAAERGWVYEKLGDLARVLRVPGTVNCKDPARPKPIEVVNSGPRWNPSELDELLDDIGVPAAEVDYGNRPWSQYAFDVDPRAQVPATMIAALTEADRTFNATWNQRRRNLKDPTPSGYELSLANIGVMAGLADQEIVNLLVHWRAIHNHPLKHKRDYYGRTLFRVRSTLSVVGGDPFGGGMFAAAAAAAPTGGASSFPPPGESQSPPPPPPPKSGPQPPPEMDKRLKVVRDSLRIPVKRFVKVKGEDPAYILELDDGRRIEMAADTVFQQTKFGQTVFHAFDAVVPRFKEFQWRNLLANLTGIVETVDRSAELTAAGKIESYLLSYLAETPFQREPLERAAAVERLYPIVRSNRVCVSASHLRLYVGQAFRQEITLPALVKLLHDLNCEPWRERIGRKNEQSRWLLPDDLFPPEDYLLPGEDTK